MEPSPEPAAGTDTPAAGISEPLSTDSTHETRPAAAAPTRPKRKRTSTRTIVEWVGLIAAAVLIAFLIRTFLFQAFYIPSESMVPTLEKNDRVLVNKLSYKLHDVHRGDIVVFKAPKNPDGTPVDPSVNDLVKRVIGLPGERVDEVGGQITINGKVLNEPYLPSGTHSDCASFAPNCFTKFGVVPKDEYWVMGDNRVASKDSRSFGFIKKSNIVGRVFIRIWPLNRIDIL